MFVFAHQLRIGMVIVEGARARKISEVDRGQCRGHVHINSDWCYNLGDVVEIQDWRKV